MFMHLTVTHVTQNHGLSETYVENEAWSLYVNRDHVAKFYRQTGKPYTVIELSNGEVYGVLNTPEELYVVYNKPFLID